MPLTINTNGAGYQNLLSSMQTINNQLENNYGPILKRMSPDQLKQLYQRDELFRELINCYKLIRKLAEAKGFGE